MNDISIHHDSAHGPVTPVGTEPVNAVLQQSRQKLLIVSTYKTSCGIAHTAETVLSRVDQQFDTTVFPLDQFILRSVQPALYKAGENLIENLCKEISKYDVVNLQWEPGLLGVTNAQILKRFARILSAAKHLVVTVHTVVPVERFSPREMLRLAIKSPMMAYRYSQESVGFYGKRTYKLLLKAQEAGQLSFVVHTKREKRFFSEAMGFRNVHDHPLSHIPATWWPDLPAAAAACRQGFESKFGKDKVFVGFFGFISEYKGIETAIRAIRSLPDNYVLLIFGQVHPSTVRKFTALDPYLKRVLSLVEGDEERLSEFLSEVTSEPAESEGGSRLALAQAKEQVVRGMSSITDRAIFMGSPESFDFAANMKACDVCIFPYLEVGQSASGPASMAVEMGKPAIVSTSKTFSEMAKYFPEKMQFFDIGNHVQLAQLLSAQSKWTDLPVDDLRFTGDTLGDFYGNVLRKTARRLLSAPVSEK